MKRNIYISAGHNSSNPSKDRGAISPYGVEGILMEEFRNLLNKELIKLNICPTLDKSDTILRDTIKYFLGKTKSSDIVIDLHLNSSVNDLAHGTETIIPYNASQIEKNLAKEINNKIVQILGTRDRGIKTDKQLGRTLGFFTIPGENILIEFVFLSNKNDMDKYQKNKEELAKELAKILQKYV